MTPEDIWHLLQTADNFLKYGDDDRARERARNRYKEALKEAEAIGNEGLVKQARLRISDLEARTGAAGEGGTKGRRGAESDHDQIQDEGAKAVQPGIDTLATEESVAEPE